MNCVSGGVEIKSDERTSGRYLQNIEQAMHQMELIAHPIANFRAGASSAPQWRNLQLIQMVPPGDQICK